MVDTFNKQSFRKIRNFLSTWSYEIATQDGGRIFQSMLEIYMGALHVYFVAEIPANWSDMKQDKLLLVNLQTSDPEYNMVASAFRQTCSNFFIEKVSWLLTRNFLYLHFECYPLSQSPLPPETHYPILFSSASMRVFLQPPTHSPPPCL
jgi:hypothetical protein